MAEKKRYPFIDNIKVAACVLVAVGHFLMSMVANKILPVSEVYIWFIRTLYSFHVPLFFVCSGFLYQKLNRVTSFETYKSELFKKLLNLGVPYFTFTGLTLLLKVFFKSNVTTEATGFLETLFVRPTAPYWFLYSLFLLFLLIPCMKSKKHAVILFSIAFVIKVAYVVFKNIPEAYIITYSDTVNPVLQFFVLRISNICDSAVWFSGGMLLTYFSEEQLKRVAKPLIPILLVAGITLSILLYKSSFGFLIGSIFVSFSVLSAILISPELENNLSAKLSGYFMPVFVLHTIGAAAVRSLLFKAGVTSFPVHILGGIIGSFVIPVIVYIICEKLVYPMFFFYPTKTINTIKCKSKNNSPEE